MKTLSKKTLQNIRGGALDFETIIGVLTSVMGLLSPGKTPKNQSPKELGYKVETGKAIKEMLSQ